jgi:regulator of protease activity HflC (stomatin/prohibitin superfamily)
MFDMVLDGQMATIAILIFIALLFIFLGIEKVPDGHTRIVERLGRRHRVLTPGINVKFPILDVVKKHISLHTILENGSKQEPLVAGGSRQNIKMAEQRMDPPPLGLLCRDNTQVTVDSVAYFRITDPMKIVYDVAAFDQTFLSLVETTLRQGVGLLDGDSILTARESLSQSLQSKLQEAASSWGISILRVEIENIEFNKEIQEKLSHAREEELLRRAEVVAAQAQADKDVLDAEAIKKTEILKAEGYKQAEIMKAEGEKQAQILRAEAQFEEQRLKAEADFLLESRKQEGQAQGYAAIVAALGDRGDSIVALRALEAQEKVAQALGEGASNTLVIPNDAAGLFGAFGAAVKGIAAMTRNDEGRGREASSDSSDRA